jgi:hypothetical protein
MKKSKSAKAQRRREAHIYMDEADYEALKHAAERNLRSIGAQAMIYVRRGLEAEG